MGAPAEDRLPLAPGGFRPGESLFHVKENWAGTKDHKATSKSHSFKWPLKHSNIGPKHGEAGFQI